MYGSDSLLDMSYLVCCLIKIHVHLKRDNRRGEKSLEDYGGNRWEARRREGQQFWGQRQSQIMLLNTCLCCRHHWMLPCEIWPFWPVTNSTGGQQRQFFFLFLLSRSLLFLVLLIFFRVVRLRDVFSGWRWKLKLPLLKIALDNGTKNKTEEADAR